MITINVSEDDVFDEISDELLLEECSRRGLQVYDKDLIETIYHLKRAGKDYNRLLDDLIYHAIGRIS